MPASRPVVTSPVRRAAGVVPPVARSVGALLTSALVSALVVVTVSLGAASAQEGRRAVVVSDSILAGAESALVARLEEAGWSVTFDAEVNRTTYSAAAVVASHRDELTDTVVLSLGANDGADRETFRRRVDSVLAEVRDVPHVYWLSLHEVRDGYVGANEVLRELERQHPNLTVLDWHSLASADAALTASDGLHLSPAGARAMAGLVGDAATQAPDPTAPPEPASVTPAPAPSELTPAPSQPAPTSDEPPVAEPHTTAPTADPDAGEDAARASSAGGGSADRSTSPWWRGIAGWTAAGFGLVLAVVLAALVVAGTWLGVWSLWSTRRPPAWEVARVRSEAHPAVRAQQRALRIAAAREEAEAALRDGGSQKT